MQHARSTPLVGRRFVKSLMLAALATGATTAAAGPDVIVGDLDQVQNWGAVGGIRAYSVGTISCNIGDQPLEWEDQPQPGFVGNVYPVISGNIYRLRDGRFQQLGQQWLKHGFCALNGNVCSSCPQQSNPGCRFLMPGCSDPYSASLNGSQGGLGPKYEVNPATGFFPVNWTAIGSNGATTGDAIYKRIQVPDAELSTTNGTYFVSSIYIHPQDSANNVDNNSQSYRRVTVSGANKDLLVTDTTKRQKPAIFAWREYGGGTAGGGVVDEGVLLSAIDVPDDGRFWVGSKVIPLGNGLYRYEYAVQNLTSHRAGRTFRVPVDANATVSGIGFSDVAYHSGERQRGDDWTSSVSNGYVTWTMPDLYADDQWENALRWDTIYNFWFVSNGAPATGNVQLQLFLPGTATDTHEAFVHTAGVGGPPPAPSNDNCANAIALGLDGTTANFDTSSATTDGNTESLCNFSNNSQIDKDVWYTFSTGNCAGDVTLSTCGSAFDTKLAVYAGGACPGTTDMALACNDDNAVCPGNNGLSSSLTFAAAANTTYRVRVGGFNGASGAGQLNVVRPVCVPQPPANDRCSDALWLVDGQTVSGSTVLATNTPADGASGCGGGAAKDVWFKYRPTVTAPVLIGTCGSNYDTLITVYNACGSAPLACNDDHSQGQSFCASNNASRISTTLVAGTTYLIRVGGFRSTSAGDFSLTVTGGGGIAPPNNDDCSGRAGLGLGNQSFTLNGATTDGPVHNGLQTNNDVWFNHPGLCTGNLRIRVCNPQGFTPRLAVYSGEGCSNLDSRFLGFASPAPSTACGNASVEYIVQGAQAGQPLTIRVGSLSASSFGTGTLQLECLPGGPNCNDIDFNNDQLFPDDSDLVAFLSVLAGASCPTASCDSIDFNNDGLFPDDNDLLSFLTVLAGGDCQ